MNVREKPPLRLGVSAETPNGRKYRWAADEPKPENVPSGIRFSSTMPGGFESADCVLPRKSAQVGSDLERLTTLTIYGPGGESVWEGRLERAPRTSGDKLSVSPSAVGWQAGFADDKSAAMPYIGRGLDGWQEPSRQRRVNLYGAGTPKVEGATAQPDATTGAPTLALMFDGEQPSVAATILEGWYDSRGGGIGAILYSYAVPVGGAASVFAQIGTSATDETSPAGTGDLVGSVSGDGVFTPATVKRWAYVQAWNQIVLADEFERGIHLTNLAVIGGHGLTLRGTAPEQGFWGSDIVAHAVGAFAPILNFTEGADGTIRPSSFVIPHQAHLEPTTCAEVLKAATRFGLQDWGVWEDKTFYWHERGAFGRNWRARVGPAQLEETGPTVERLWESIEVAYQDVDGTTRTVGPPGSGADTESADLQDDDPENPATKLGIIRRDLLTMGTATAASATELGRRFLEETKLLDGSGRATIVGHVEDDRGVLHAAWKVRAGDTITFVDAADSASARRVVKADYSHDSRSCSIDLDAPPEGLAALLERLGVVLIPLGIS